VHVWATSFIIISCLLWGGGCAIGLTPTKIMARLILVATTRVWDSPDPFIEEKKKKKKN